MRAFSFYLLIFILLSFLITSCKDEIEDFKLESPSEYLSLQPGKYITYRLDSTVFTQTGSVQEVHSYQEKMIVDGEFTDNLGRKSYRLYRFLRNVAGTTPWISAGSFFITPTEGEAEIIENNLRVVKIVAPINEGEIWKGNRFLATDPYKSSYEFSDDNHIHLEDWEFSYAGKGETLSLNNQTINNILTVKGPDISVNATISDPKAFGSRTFSIDKYAKNLGLVYQELILWEYQPNPGGTPFRVGFGVKRSMIDHN
jgi:hypothetical protein